MWLEVLMAILLGVLVKGWLGILLFPALIASYSVGSDYFFIKKHISSTKDVLTKEHKQTMSDSGMSDEEIDEVQKTLSEEDKIIYDFDGSLYWIQFRNTYFLALGVALVTRLIVHLFS